ncbi:MAG TPA: MgtC/SapB family protein [Gemmataceae bacterium]|nr:MgtC/SapB family protein [Gemmataceae bacterium]
MNPVRDEIFWGVTDLSHFTVLVVRLLVAAALGGLIGLERQEEGKAAGLRTHMLVALGTALFVVAPILAGMELSELGRVIQGVAAGIGFVGAGVILKLKDEQRVKGLTTAASVWLTAGVGVAVGLGALWSAVFAVCLAWLILFVLRALEKGTSDRQTPSH